MKQKNREEIILALKKNIERKLDEGNTIRYAFYGYLVKRFYRNVADDKELVDWLVTYLIDTDKSEKQHFVETFFEDDDEFNLRICDTCGSWMIEGYYLAGEYACCDECAIQNYMDTSIYHPSPSREESERLFKQDLELDEKNCLGEVYWTDWR